MVGCWGMGVEWRGRRWMPLGAVFTDCVEYLARYERKGRLCKVLKPLTITRMEELSLLQTPTEELLYKDTALRSQQVEPRSSAPP